MDECLAYFQALVDDPKSVQTWQEWWSENCDLVKSLFPRDQYLKLKFRRIVAVRQILIERGLLEDDGSDALYPQMGDTHCNVCGTELFWALPGKTTPDEISAYAELIGNEQLKTDRWIHPGVYCPNNCTCVLFNIAPNRDDWPWLTEA